jgi:hypothetical protein
MLRIGSQIYISKTVITKDMEIYPRRIPSAVGTLNSIIELLPASIYKYTGSPIFEQCTKIFEGIAIEDCGDKVLVDNWNLKDKADDFLLHFGHDRPQSKILEGRIIEYGKRFVSFLVKNKNAFDYLEYHILYSIIKFWEEYFGIDSPEIEVPDLPQMSGVMTNTAKVSNWHKALLYCINREILNKEIEEKDIIINQRAKEYGCNNGGTFYTEICKVNSFGIKFEEYLYYHHNSKIQLAKYKNYIRNLPKYDLKVEKYLKALPEIPK